MLTWRSEFALFFFCAALASLFFIILSFHIASAYVYVRSSEPIKLFFIRYNNPGDGGTRRRIAVLTCSTRARALARDDESSIIEININKSCVCVWVKVGKKRPETEEERQQCIFIVHSRGPRVIARAH